MPAGGRLPAGARADGSGAETGWSKREVVAMDILMSPFVRLWNWVEEVGGFPGQVFFMLALVMLGIAGATWFNNKR
jgi:hypothetical protein